MGPVLEPSGLVHEICAVSHKLPEVAHILGEYPSSRNEVRPEELGQGPRIDLVCLDLGFRDGSGLQRMSQHRLEPSLLDALTEELPDIGRLEDEHSVLEPVQEAVEFLLGGRGPLVREDTSRAVYLTTLAEFLIYVQSRVQHGLLPPGSSPTTKWARGLFYTILFYSLLCFDRNINRTPIAVKGAAHPNRIGRDISHASCGESPGISPIPILSAVFCAALFADSTSQYVKIDSHANKAPATTRDTPARSRTFLCLRSLASSWLNLRRPPLSFNSRFVAISTYIYRHHFLIDFVVGVGTLMELRPHRNSNSRNPGSGFPHLPHTLEPWMSRLPQLGQNQISSLATPCTGFLLVAILQLSIGP
jgi:hypothetical protein